MTVELTPEQEEVIEHLAMQDGKTASQILIETATWLANSEDAVELNLIEERLAEADQGGNWISHEDVGRRLGLS